MPSSTTSTSHNNPNTPNTAGLTSAGTKKAMIMSGNSTTRTARSVLDRSVLALSAVLAFGVGLWTHTLHWRAGIREASNIAFAPHFLRDASLSVPLILMAVLAARVFVPRSRVVAPAIAASLALALGVPFHAGLFGHANHAGIGPVHSTPVMMLLELVVDIPMALLLARLMSVSKQAVAQGAKAWAPRIGYSALTVAIGSAGLVAVASAPAGAASSVCPATSTATRRYDVTAINVDIPLNRYGDHDPAGKMYALTSEIPAIRAQEKSRIVTPGLGEDPIQPLVVRANEGDCVEITLHNSLSTDPIGVSIDGLPSELSGDNVGRNVSSEVPVGGQRMFRFYVPNDPALEGSHYLHSGPGHRALVDHGLFGVLSVEPPASQWLSQVDSRPILSGWAAMIVPAGAPSFRENVQILHEIGNETESVYDKNNNPLPQVDPITEAYRPGGRGFNYRSEPFMNRLAINHHEKAHSYSSSMFGDPATVIPKGYVGDPTKFRVVHAGAEVFHVYHLHGGGDRWRLNPEGDPSNNYANTGLAKTPVEQSASDRLDAYATGPGESFNAEIENGAGGAQQGAGDFLFHCHIAEHYPAGMWGFWRVYDTLQPDVAPLPDRAPMPKAVTSVELIGDIMPNGVVVTADNLDGWIRPQLPAQGTAIGDQDATVWDWTVDRTDPTHPLYLGEPEQKTAIPPDFEYGVAGHPGSLKVDKFTGDRPALLFNPLTGRPAYPLLRPHSLRRPPFTANEHSGAPYLGETADQLPLAQDNTPQPWTARKDGLCPADAPVKNFNVVAIGVNVPVTKRKSDPLGMVFSLAADKAGLQNGSKKIEPLALRANVGDCMAITLTSEETDAAVFGGFAKVEMHIHHVQFDPQGSDGTSAGYNFEHAIRPYTTDDTKLTAATVRGDSVLHVGTVRPVYRPGVAFGIGLGTEQIETATIVSVDAAAGTITLNHALRFPHAVGEGAGTEFIRYRWYADALLDNIFWHDHVDGIHGWGHGGVGQLVIEPRGSTYTDPATGLPLRSGTIADIHYNPVVMPDGSVSKPLAPGLVNGDFREMVLWTLDDNPVTDSTINLHAEPFSDRNTDVSTRFSSYTWGDPTTPLLKAYPGDSVVIRAIHVGPTIDSLRLDGHRFYVEKRATNPANGQVWTRVTDAMAAGVSERYTLILDGGAGGPSKQPGDYLYHNGIARRFRQGAWGIMRVLPASSATLKPLVGNAAPAGVYVEPKVTGLRPPALPDPGNSVCPTAAFAARKTFAISAVDAKPAAGVTTDVKLAYVLTADVAKVKASGVAEPLVLHVNEGDCIDVTFRNDSTQPRASFDVSELAKSAKSSGVNIGFTPEQMVGPGQSRHYILWADKVSIEAALFSDFGIDDSAKKGLYGAIVVAEKGAWFSDPKTGAKVTTGATVDVHLGAYSYRDASLILAENDPQIGADFMPYPKDVSGVPTVNYRNGGKRTDNWAGDPTTNIITAYAGDPLRIHVMVSPGSEQPHVFLAGGMSWLRDPYMPHSQEVAEQAVSPTQGIDIHMIGGAGGRLRQTRDYWFGDIRRPFAEGGMWGIIRVVSDSKCPIKALDTRTCVGTPGP